MFLVKESLIQKVLPLLRYESYRLGNCFLVQSSKFSSILLFLKNHFNYQYKMLTCISGVDYPDNTYRFCLVYELLSLKMNNRIRIKVLLNELTPMESVEKIFPSALWWECEIWDMFGVFFSEQKNLTRLLTDYGFQGYPLRKDFPLSGFTESRYNYSKNRVVYETLELAQEYRTFDFLSPWEQSSKKK